MDGYNFIKENTGAYASALLGENTSEYLDAVKNEIQHLLNDLNSFEGTKKDINFLKGDVAEFWHADTFNIDAALNNSTHRMNVPRSNALGSVDVESMFDESKYSLKYYKDGVSSAKAQAKSVLEGSHGRHGSAVDSLYEGQYRLIPKGQLSDAEELLKRKIAEESTKRPEQVGRYKETLELLREKISDGSGNESISLSEEDAKKIALVAKEGGATEETLESFGLGAKEAIMKQTIADICKAGLTAATISLVLKSAPEIISVIEQLIKTGELDEGQFKNIGFTALTGSSEGFVRGSVAASIMVCLKQSSVDVSPAIVGALTVVAFDTMKNAFLVSAGKKTSQDLTNELIKEMYVSTCALIGAGLAQGSFPTLPVLSYMMGSFIGSAIGSLTYEFGYKTAISFCVDNGVTMFGLVKQDYVLPKDVIKEIGIEVFDYETFDIETFEPDSFTVESFSPDSFAAEKLCISFLRRGVIGVSKIGYV